MKTQLIICLLTVGFALSACVNKGGGAESQANVNALNTENNEEMDDLLKEMNEQQGHDEKLGVKTIRGKLTTDKGFSPRVDGIFIAREFFAKDDKKWQEEVEALKGKKVELKGMVIRHHCGPYEQCLSQGYMDWMREPEYIKVL